MRRKYEPGRCADGCADAARVTWVTYWLNGMKLQLCARCVRAYKHVILK